MNKYFYFLVFLLSCVYILINCSEPSTEINYKNQTIKDNLKTFFNSFDQTKQCYIQKNYRATAWNACGTKELLNTYNLKSFVKQNIQEELDNILINSHISINKPDLILSEIQRYLYNKNYPTSLTSDLSIALFNKSLNLKNNIIRQKLLETQSDFLYTKLSDRHAINLSIDIIKNEKSESELRNKHLSFLWNFAIQKNNMQAQCFMTHAYYKGLYGLEKNIEKALKYSDYYTENLIHNFNKQVLPLERFAVYAFLNECNDTYAKILLLYCQYAELLLVKDQSLLQKIFNLSHNIPDKHSAIRNEALPLLCNSENIPQKKSTKFNEILCKNNFADFVSSDADFLIPLLQHKLKSSNKKNEIHHLLGLIFYQKNQLKESYKHFNNIIPYLEEKKDVLSLCKLFDALNQNTSTLSLDHIHSGIKILKIIFNSNALNKHLSTVCNLLKYDALSYAVMLLNNKKYEDAYFLAQKCMHYPDSYITGLSIIQAISDSLDPKNCNYEQQLNTLYHSFAYQKIKELSEKDNTSDSYKCMCQITSHHAMFQKNILSGKTIQCIEYVLNNNLCLESDVSTLKKLCSDFYYQKGQINNSCNAYKKAATYGNTKAILDKAWLMISQKNLSERTLNKITFMLHDYLPEENNELLIKIFSKMASIYSDPVYRESTDDNFPNIKPNASKGFYYSKKAYELGDTEKGAIFLAQYYFEGIPDILPSNSNKVIEICTRCIKNNHKCNPRCFYLRGFSSYDINDYNNALNDFTITINSSLCLHNKLLRQQIFLRMGLLKLKNVHNKKARNIALQYFVNAFFKDTETFDEKALNPFLYNKNLFKQLKIHTDDIITTKSKEKIDLSLCYYAGGIFYFAIKKNKYKQHALKCLKYAAKNGIFNSAISLASLPEEDVNRYYKIKYIGKALSPDNIFPVKSIFPELMLDTIKSKYEFIKSLNNEQNKIQKFLSSPIFIVFDRSIEHSWFTKTNNVLAEQALSDDLLKSYVEEFNLTLDKAPIHVKNGAFLYALMLAGSDNIKYLQISASYLHKLSNYYDKRISDLLGMNYLKIGNHFFQQKQTILAKSYLQKSAELGNIDAKKSLDNIEKKSAPNIVLPTKPQISIETYTINPSSLTKQILPGNTLLKTLVAFRESEEYLNKKYQKAISQLKLAKENNLPIDITFLENVANKEKNPHAALQMADHLVKKLNIPMAIKYIKLGLDESFISLDQKTYLFKDEHLLNMVSNLLINIIKGHKNSKEIHNLVLCIRTILQNYTIDLKAFVEHTKRFRGYDLTQDASWTY